MQTYHPVPADVQQVLLQDLLPMVVQISSAVLALPGPAAYRGYSSSRIQSSIPAAEVPGLTDFLKLHVGVCLTRCVTCAAYPSNGSSTAPVLTAALGAHVLPIAQLFEAVVRRSQQLTGPQYDRHWAMETLSGLCRYLHTLCCVSEAAIGAFLHVASSSSAAEDAGVSAEHAQVQFASLCCSILKAAAASAAMPGAVERHIDATFLLVASALSGATAGPWCVSPASSWYLHAEFTAASGVAWLAISGRVLLHLAERLEYAAGGATPGSITVQAGASAANAQLQGIQSPVLGAIQDGYGGLSRSVLHELQMESLVLCWNILDLLLFAPASQELSAAGYGVPSLQQQLGSFLQSVNGVQTVLLIGEQVAALRSLGLTFTTLAFPGAVPATTQHVASWQGRWSCSWSTAAAACAPAAVWPTTVAGSVSGGTGSSTSRCATPLLQHSMVRPLRQANSSSLLLMTVLHESRLLCFRGSAFHHTWGGCCSAVGCAHVVGATLLTLV
jgi:hypothetical protein